MCVSIASCTYKNKSKIKIIKTPKQKKRFGFDFWTRFCPNSQANCFICVYDFFERLMGSLLAPHASWTIAVVQVATLQLKTGDTVDMYLVYGELTTVVIKTAISSISC